MSREQKKLVKQIRRLDAHERRLDSQLSRRKFILGAAAVAAAFVYADQGLANIKWGDKQTEVQVLPEYQDIASDELWVVGPGLGVQSTEGIASTLKSSLEKTAPVAYMQIADEGLSISGLAYHLDRLAYERKVKKIHLYGHSIGTPTLIQIINQLDIEVGTLLSDGSPYDVTDVHDESLTLLVKRFVEHYPPGYVSKLLGESYNSTIRDPNHSLSTVEQLQDALRITNSGIAPQAWADQLVFISNVDTSTYQEKITEKTRTAYLKPRIPENDRVVDVVRANSRYDRTFYNAMASLDMDIGWHASPTDFPGQYNHAISQYLTRLTMTRRSPRLHKP